MPETTPPADGVFNPDETARRRDEALRRALNTPPKRKGGGAERKHELLKRRPKTGRAIRPAS